MPWEYIELVLMRDVYHCTREELYEQDLDGIIMDLELLGVEAKVREFEDKKRK